MENNSLYYHDWPTPKDHKGAIILIHGLGEHCQRYAALAAYLNDAGYSLYSMDLPCHGQSTGTRGHIDSFDIFQDAALGLYKRVKQGNADTPLFILGHSMGGLIVTRLLQSHQDKFQGALLSGAAIESPQEPPAWQVSLITLISKLLPKLGALQLDASGISRDPAVVEKYMADPLVDKGKLSAKFLVEMFKTMALAKEQANKISLPILIMHGGKDPMTAPSGSQFLYDNISSQDKELKLYDGLMHEIFNEPEAMRIYKELVDWLNQRIGNMDRL